MVVDFTEKEHKLILEVEIARIDERFDKLKKIISDYLSLGSDFARGSLITALEQV